MLTMVKNLENVGSVILICFLFIYANSLFLSWLPGRFPFGS